MVQYGIMKTLPIIAQSIVYRKSGLTHEVLVLKRSKKDGGFWSLVNGTLEFDESIPECRNRELLEEVGIQNVKKWSDEIHRFTFRDKDATILVLVYAAKIEKNITITLNHEHTEYKWLSFDDAIGLVKYNDDKNGLRACRDQLSTNRHE